MLAKLDIKLPLVIETGQHEYLRDGVTYIKKALLYIIDAPAVKAALWTALKGITDDAIPVCLTRAKALLTQK